MAAAAVAVAVGAGALIWIGPAEAAVAGPGYGYLWLDDPAPTVGVEYTPTAFYQRNSTGARNTVTRRSTGSYDLYFPNLARFGTPMVTAYGDSSERCKIGSWRGAAWPRSGTVVTVRCTARTGAAVNTRFTATYAYATAASASSTGGGAYLWSDRPAPSLDVPYTPNTAYQLNTTGQQNTVTRLRTGYYVVRIEGLSQLTGLVVVATGGSAGTYCGTVAGKAAVTYFLAYLQCSASDGQPADSAFALTFVESGNTMFAPVTGSAYAFIFCYEDFSDEFGGPRTCQSAGGEPLPPGTSASWVSPGVYEVHLPTDMSAGNVQITPNGGDSQLPDSGRCKIMYWQWDTHPCAVLRPPGKPTVMGLLLRCVLCVLTRRFGA